MKRWFAPDSALRSGDLLQLIAAAMLGLLLLPLQLQAMPASPQQPLPPLLRDLFGVSIDRAGDLDGDGIEDLWVGDPSLSGTSDGTCSCVWAVSGATGLSIRRIKAPAESLGFGSTVCALDDLEQAGARDVAVGCEFLGTTQEVRWKAGIGLTSPQGEGAVFIYSKMDGSLQCTVRGPADECKVPWYTALGGPALCAVGDWDEDCIGDLAIGWAYADSESMDCGRVDVVSRAGGRILQSWNGVEDFDRLGAVLCAVGDLDGDGKTEIAATAWPNRTTETGSAGKTVERRANGYVQVLSSRGKTFATLRPAGDGTNFGLSLALLPKPAKEGSGTLLVGHPFRGSEIQVWSLSQARVLQTFEKPGLKAWCDGWGNQFISPPQDAVDLSFGARLLLVSDRDDDGLADVLVTVPEAFCYVPAGIISSKTGKSLAHLRIRISDERGYDYTHLGLSACELRDIDGDSMADFALGGASVRSDCQGSVIFCSGKALTPIRYVVGAELRR